MNKSSPRTLILATSYAPELRRPELRPTEYARTDYVELASVLDCDILDYSIYDGSSARSTYRQIERKIRLDFHLALAGYRRARAYDVVLLMSERVAIPYGLLCRAFGKRSKPVTLSMHSSLRQARLVRRFGLCENYEAVISFTPAQQEFLVGEMGISSNRISYIPYSVDEEFFCFSKGAEDGYVLTVGGVPGRDYSTFAEALRNTQYDVKMVLGGRSDGRNTAIGVGGIPPTFEIYSRLSSVDMRDLYRGASVVVVPLTRGRADAAGSSVLLEAMSSGRPVVLSATPGISPYAEHGVTGLLVEPGSPQALREAVDRLMMDHSLRTAIGEEGRAFVERKLTLRQYVDRLRKVIGGGRVCWPLGEPKEVAS